MSALEEYLIDGDDLPPEQRDQMGQAVLRAMQADAIRFQTDIPQLKPTDPPTVHAAADVLRSAAGKKSGEDLKYATTGWLDANDAELWDAYVTFMPWSIAGDVWDQEGRQIVSVDDGVVSVVAIAHNRVPEIGRIVGTERLTPLLGVQAERRAERRRWMIRHPDSLIGAIAVGLGLLLIPLPLPGWPVLAAGALVLVAGAAVRGILRGHQT